MSLVNTLFHLQEKWSSVESIRCEIDVDLHNYTTLKLSVLGSLITISSLEGLQQVLRDLSQENINYFILGRGSNVVCTNSKSNVFLLLDFPLDREYLNSYRESYLLPASCPLSLLTSVAIRYGLKGWEVFTGIPGNLGGSVAMNAGTALGEIGKLIRKVAVVTPRGELKEYEKTMLKFSYRKNTFLLPGECIYQVEIEHLGQDREISESIKSYLRKRKEQQPLDKNSCGCVFKNKKEENCNYPAGMFIDRLGLSGLGVGSLKVSNKHANFIEHQGGASYTEFMHLVEMLQDELLLNYGINFEPEFQFLGNR